MRFLTTFTVLAVLGLGMLSIGGCSKSGDNTTGTAPVDKPVVGDQQTEDYAEKPVSVENRSTDPYTGTQDEENYAGKHPVAEDQTAGEKMMDKQDKNQQ